MQNTLLSAGMHFVRLFNQGQGDANHEIRDSGQKAHRVTGSVRVSF